MTITAVQTSVTAFPDAGVEGMLYDDGSFKDVIPKIALVDIPFGAFVKITSAGCTLPALTGDVTATGRGVALQDQTKATQVGYKAGDVVNVLQQGRCWIRAEGTESLTAYASPYVRYTANTTPTRPIGGWAGTSDSGKNVQPAGVRMFSSTLAGGGLAVVEMQPYNAGATGAVGATGATGATGPTGPTGPTG